MLQIPPELIVYIANFLPSASDYISFMQVNSLTKGALCDSGVYERWVKRQDVGILPALCTCFIKGFRELISEETKAHVIASPKDFHTVIQLMLAMDTLSSN